VTNYHLPTIKGNLMNEQSPNIAITSNPSFLIEMSHQHRHIVMRRAYFLRSTRARTMFCREKIAGKSWLEVALAEKAKVDSLPWDQAHSLADRLRAELKTDMFVEPASESGRHHQLTAPVEAADPFDAAKQFAGGNQNSQFGIDPMAGLFGGGGSGRGSSAGAFGVMPNMPGMPNIPGMPNLGGTFNFGGGQSPTDFLPAHVKEALSFGESKSKEIILPSLRQLPAFNELPEALRNMFEVEAVQALRELTSQFGVSEHSGDLISLSQLPNVSKRLKQFLSQALTAAAA